MIGGIVTTKGERYIVGINCKSIAYDNGYWIVDDEFGFVDIYKYYMYPMTLFCKEVVLKHSTLYNVSITQGEGGFKHPGGTFSYDDVIRIKE